MSGPRTFFKCADTEGIPVWLSASPPWCLSDLCVGIAARLSHNLPKDLACKKHKKVRGWVLLRGRHVSVNRDTHNKAHSTRIVFRWINLCPGRTGFKLFIFVACRTFFRLRTLCAKSRYQNTLRMLILRCQSLKLSHHGKPCLFLLDAVGWGME